MDENKVLELLRLKEDSQYLHHRENQELEFKEQFNLAGLADYLKDFAAFANHKGGYLVFGIKDKPRIRTGLSQSSKKHFEKVDPELITGYLLQMFSSEIIWEQAEIEIDGKTFGVFRIEEALVKPVIAKTDAGKDNLVIRNGEIYYRYGGRTQKIQHAELEAIINRRIKANNEAWVERVARIGESSPENVAILDTEKSLMNTSDRRVLVVDESLTKKIKFIREGDFAEKEGATTLRVVGDVTPIDQVEVIKRVKEDLLKSYPYSATELNSEVRKRVPKAKQGAIWQAMKENGMKGNPDYSTYNHRNRSAEQKHLETGDPGSTPVIYNEGAVEFLTQVMQNQIAADSK